MTRENWQNLLGALILSGFIFGLIFFSSNLEKSEMLAVKVSEAVEHLFVSGMSFFSLDSASDSDVDSARDADVYAQVSRIDGGSILIPYSNSKKAEYLAEQAAPFHNVLPKAGLIEIGSEAIVPGREWINVMNDSPVIQHFSNGVGELKFGDTCLIEFGGFVEIKEISNDSLGVAYSAPGNPKGTPCSSGVQFVVSRSDFMTMTNRYSDVRDAVLFEKDTVSRLIAQKYYGKEMDAGDWRWVDVVNVDPVVQKYTNGSRYIGYGETCGVGRSNGGDGYVNEGGTVQVRGEVAKDNKILYEYTPKGEPKGTPCPLGIFFFDKVL